MRCLGLGLLATTALATCGAEALAGNPAANPSYQTPAPVFDPWTGWYVGGNVGGSWGRARSDFSISGFATSVSTSDSIDPDGVIGGGQLGYNWQVDPNWLIGAETDIQASGEKASGTRFDTVDFEGVTTNYETKIEWFGTVRGRLGYAFNRRSLLYATGGLAYGRVSVSGASSSIGTTSFSGADVDAGWTAGAASKAWRGIRAGPGKSNIFTWTLERWIGRFPRGSQRLTLRPSSRITSSAPV